MHHISHGRLHSAIVYDLLETAGNHRHQGDFLDNGIGLVWRLLSADNEMGFESETKRNGMETAWQRVDFIDRYTPLIVIPTLVT